jgi:hypothetical protein
MAVTNVRLIMGMSPEGWLSCGSGHTLMKNLPSMTLSDIRLAGSLRPTIVIFPDNSL